jgi:hypothetical protein
MSSLTRRLVRVLRAIPPRRIDQLLYAYEAEVPTCDATLQVERYSINHRSGILEIDSRLSESNLCYAVLADSKRVAHVSWVFKDTRLPCQAGFDAMPVIGECFTDPAFRGQHIYPRVLAHILRDLISGGQSKTAYMLVAPDNESSIHGIERAGFVRKAHIRGIRIAGMLFTDLSSGDRGRRPHAR